MTFLQAYNKIKKLGGFAHIHGMPLEQRNAYAAQELGDSLSLNKTWLYGQAMKKNIDLSIKLKEFDGMRDGTKSMQAKQWHWMWKMIDDLDD